MLEILGTVERLLRRSQLLVNKKPASVSVIFTFIFQWTGLTLVFSNVKSILEAFLQSNQPDGLHQSDNATQKSFKNISSASGISRSTGLPAPVTLSDRGIDILNQLISEEALRSELDSIKQMASEIDKRPHTADFVAAVEAQIIVDNMIEELPVGPWTDVSATLAITQLVQAVELVPVVRWQLAEGRILERAMLWESANSHLTVYRWYTDVGPTLARVLFDAH